MANLEKLNATDLDALIALIDEVFTEENGKPMDFRNRFPRVFKPDDEKIGWYYGIKENGELHGTAGLHPFPYRVLENTLKVGQVGNVAVSSKCRGRGFMQTILNKMCEDMEKDGYDMAYLHGERKRYRTFGFERCGIEYVFTMTQSLPRALKLPDEFNFVDMRATSPEDVAEAIAIAKSRVHNFERIDGEYLDSFTAHEAKPLLVKNALGETVGYLCYSPLTNMVIELGLKNPADFALVSVSLLNYLKIDSLQITFAEYENELIGSAMTVCRRYEVVQSGNFKILNFGRVLETFMNAKASYAPLLDGEITLDTELFGRWRVEVRDGKSSVTRTDAEADLYVEGYKVYPLLFGPTSPYAAGVDMSGLDPEPGRLIQSWFPVPLYCENFS